MHPHQSTLRISDGKTDKPLFSLSRRTSHLIENLSLKRFLKPLFLSLTFWFCHSHCVKCHRVYMCTQSHTKSTLSRTGSDLIREQIEHKSGYMGFIFWSLWFHTDCEVHIEAGVSGKHHRRELIEHVHNSESAPLLLFSTGSLN